jgi:hypothetical protein
MDKYPLIIAGSRSITDYDILIDAMSAFLIDPDHIAEVISGKEPNGVDRLGEQMAEAFGILVIPFPAAWENQGRAAGPIRNAQMAKYAAEHGGRLLAIRGRGESRGTDNMIQVAGLARVPTLIWYP